jgi:hypothetical protein
LGNGHLPDVRSRRGFRFDNGKHGFRHSIPKLKQVSECKLSILTNSFSSSAAVQQSATQTIA